MYSYSVGFEALINGRIWQGIMPVVAVNQFSAERTVIDWYSLNSIAVKPTGTITLEKH